MWVGKGLIEKKSGGKTGLVAIAVDRDKGSQYAIRWAAGNLLSRGQAVILIHVHQNSLQNNSNLNHHPHSASDLTHLSSSSRNMDKQTKELFLTFHCFCSQKDIHCLDVVLEDTDVARAVTQYVSYAGIEYLVVGATTRYGFIRLKSSQIPSNISKGAPDFCNVYVITKGKVSSVRKASRPAPHASPLHEQIDALTQQSAGSERQLRSSLRGSLLSSRDKTFKKPCNMYNESIKSAMFRGRTPPISGAGDMSEPDTDISFVSSGRPSSDRTSSQFDNLDSIRLSMSSDTSPLHLAQRFNDRTSVNGYSYTSHDSERTSTSYSSQNMDDVDVEMRRLKLELKQTMEMYSKACREALTAQQKAVDLQRWRLEEEQRLEEARNAQEAAISIADKERTRCKAAIEEAEAAHRVAELEARRRLNAEMKALKEAEEMKKVVDMMQLDVRYRRYTIEEIESATDHFAESHKIGEGGYGPVFKCYLDHTPVAVKVLRPDAAQGRSQFLQEVEVLSRIRHPNMVLLLGACPEYGCLVYEYMANGSLEDCLLRRGNSPALSWQIRFRIAAEIATGLLFLHQTKPEPLVHRDLKPGNILLDSNYVSKIGDVGLARLVPPSADESVTQYRMTSTAGTLCYIDPEYQQTGMLGVKSDVFSFGIVLLQLITAKPPMGIAHNVTKAIEAGDFAGILDPEVVDFPSEETLCLAQLALRCVELRRKDRPDLGKVILPELNKLRDFAQEKRHQCSILGSAPAKSPPQTYFSRDPEVMSDPQLVHSGSSNA